MAKYRVMVARPTGNGWERTEIGTTLVEIVGCSLLDPEVAPHIEDIVHAPIQRFPTSVARNLIVQKAKETNCDFIFMLDVDGAPKEGTFKFFFAFLRAQPVPSIIAAPYCSGDGNVQVFRFFTNQFRKEPLDSWQIDRIPRDSAIRETGVERVASIGTHCIMFDTRVFDKLPKPWFSYDYNPDQTAVHETEDCWCMRQALYADIPVYCAWDYRAGHYKELRVDLPMPMQLKDIPEFYLRKARAEVLKEMRNGDTANVAIEDVPEG